MGADDARKLFVGGISDSITEETLRDIFEGSGQAVTDVHVPRDRESGRPRGFAFVTFATADGAEIARRTVDGAVHGGRAISVRPFSQEGPRRAPQERAPRQDDCTVFVGKLPYDASNEEVQALFAAHDLAVARVSLPTGPDGRPRGFGFVTLQSAEDAAAAVDALRGAQLRGRSCVVTPAQPRGKPGAGPRDAGEPRPEVGRMPPRFGGPSARTPRFEDRQMDPSDHHPNDDLGGGGAGAAPQRTSTGEGSRRDDKKRKKEKKKKPPERSPRRERGGAGTWHRWEPDDE